MEIMKRVISGFLALVLILGMVPGISLSAFAEEVETLPQTTAEEPAAEETETVQPTETEEPASAQTSVPQVTETQAAPTEPQATEPQGTTAPETEPAVTEPQQTEPKETEAEETEPQETETQPAETEETEPAETEETVPEETLEKLNASDEAMMDEVVDDTLVNGITVYANKTLTYVGDVVELTAEVTPSNASNKEVTFRILSEYEGKTSSTEYDPELLERGFLKATAAGEFAVVADSADENYIFEEDEDAKPVWVKFVDYQMKINTKPIPKKNWYDADGDGEHGTEGDVVKVKVDNSVTVSVHYLRDGEVDTALPTVTPNVKWTVSEEDAQYVNLVQNPADCREVTVFSKNITETKYITLIATDENLWNLLNDEDRNIARDTLLIAVYPHPYKIEIYEGEYPFPDYVFPPEDAKVITDGTYLVDTNEANYENEKDFWFSARVWPLEAEEPLAWSFSNAGVRIIEKPIISEDPKEFDTHAAKLTADQRTGTTDLTIKTTTMPKNISAKVTIKRAYVVPGIFFDPGKLTGELLAGKSHKFAVADIQTKTVLKSDKVKWELSEEDQNYATLSKEGQLTAKKGITVGKKVTVKCHVIDNPAAALEWDVIIRPLGTEVEILESDSFLTPGGEERSVSVNDGVVNGQTRMVSTEGDRCAPFKLEARVLPEDNGDEYGAKQEVTWTSSNTSVAAIDPYTNEIRWKKNGVTKITAKAADGSGKSAWVTLSFGVPAGSMEIVTNTTDDSSPFQLRSGKSHTLSVEFSNTPTNQKVTWSVVDRDEDTGAETPSKYASISATSGRLSAKTVYEPHTVWVKAVTQDGSEVKAELEVEILPKEKALMLLDDSGNYVTKQTLMLAAGESVTLSAETHDLEGNITEFIDPWKSSNRKVATVTDEAGESTTVEVVGAGSATITAKASDGRSATVTIKGVYRTEYIEKLNEPTALASGKSVTLKAKSYYEDAATGKLKTPTNSKLAWSIEGDGAKYVTVNNGKVTAKAGYNGIPVDVTVTASATDGSEVTADWTLTIAPVAQGVQILKDGAVTSKFTYGLRTPATKEAPEGVEGFQLEAAVYPTGKAAQDVTWTTSSKSIATVDSSGNVTCLKAGNVTITATAADGSNKKAAFKLTIVQLTDSDPDLGGYWNNAGITIDDSGALVIAGGKNLTLKPIFLDGNGTQVKGKKLEWFVEDYTEAELDDVPLLPDVMDIANAINGKIAVKSFKNGVLSTTAVTAPKLVKVTVRTVELYDEWEHEMEIPVWITPATTKVEITRGGDVVKETILWSVTAAEVEEAAEEVKAAKADKRDVDYSQLPSLDIFAAYAAPQGTANDPDFVACQSFKWTSSNKNIAYVDEVTGEIYMLKPGTVKITATAIDGTNRKDTITLKIDKK